MHSGTIVENDVYWRGLDRGHEPLSMYLWIEILRRMQPRFILDIGANTGLYGVVAKIFCPHASVHFFEPAPAAQTAISESLRANQISDNVFIHEVFLSDETELRKELFVSSSLDFDYVYEVSTGAPCEITMEREVWKLVDLFKTKFSILSPGSIDLVKVDIEGHEYRALKGFENYLTQNTIFLIEILDQSAANKLSDFFPSSDYFFVNIDDHSCTYKIQDELTSSFKWNVLVVPKSNLTLIEEILVAKK